MPEVYDTRSSLILDTIHDPNGPGWFTFEELHKKTRIPKVSLRAILHRMVEKYEVHCNLHERKGWQYGLFFK